MEFDIHNINDLSRTYKRVKMDRTYNKLVSNKISFYVRYGTECNELVYDGEHRVYSTGRNNFPAKMIFLFSVVKSNCVTFLKKHEDQLVLPPKMPTMFMNYDYDHKIGKITGTDLNHAFWRIAYVKGYISKKTYERGLVDEAKALRLATLSVLGTAKFYDYYVEGMFKERFTVREEDLRLKDIYKDIRYSCYYMMYELSQLLGNDFDSWKTDCIYYRDTPENRKLVHDYFEEREMLFKQLIYNTMDYFKNPDSK